MSEQAGLRDPGECLLPHLNAAYNLARWLTRDDPDAEDVVQEACLRALRFLDGFRGGDFRAWLLKIVRNTSYTWLRRNRPRRPTIVFDEEMHSDEGERTDPSTLLLQKADRGLIRRALAELPVKLREMLVMRELEGLSYKEIAEVADIPMGTVMSSLARGRARLRNSVSDLLKSDPLLEVTSRTAPRVACMEGTQGIREGQARCANNAGALYPREPVREAPACAISCQ